MSEIWYGMGCLRRGIAAYYTSPGLWKYGLIPILILLAIPFLLRPRGTEADPASGEADKLVMITAHNESIRYEYEPPCAGWFTWGGS